MRCPTLWVIGTKNENAFKSAEAYKLRAQRNSRHARGHSLTD